MKNCISIRHATCNEDGNEEVTFEYESGLIRSMLKKSTKKETFVKCGPSWRNKKTFVLVTDDEHWEISCRVSELKTSLSELFI